MTDLPTIRSVVPWWYVGGSVVALGVSIAVAALVDVGYAAAMWGPMIGIEIRERRMRVAAHPRTAAQRGRSGPAWVEAVTAAVYLPVSIGLAALVHQVPFLRDEPVEVGVVAVGAGLVLVPACVVLAVILVARHRRRRAARP